MPSCPFGPEGPTRAFTSHTFQSAASQKMLSLLKGDTMFLSTCQRHSDHFSVVADLHCLAIDHDRCGRFLRGNPKRGVLRTEGLNLEPCRGALADNVDGLVSTKKHTSALLNFLCA